MPTSSAQGPVSLVHSIVKKGNLRHKEIHMLHNALSEKHILSTDKIYNCDLGMGYLY